MANHFERLPEQCVETILKKVRSEAPNDLRHSIRPVCKSFLKMGRTIATKLTLVDLHAFSRTPDAGFSLIDEYSGLKELIVDTRCCELAKTVGLERVSWERIRIIQMDPWADDDLQEGSFLLSNSKRTLRVLEFEVGTSTCDDGVSHALWGGIQAFLSMLDESVPLELSVKNLSFLCRDKLEGASVVRSLTLDMACDMFSIAAPYVFPNLERLLIIDTDAPGSRRARKSGERPQGSWASPGRKWKCSSGCRMWQSIICGRRMRTWQRTPSGAS